MAWVSSFTETYRTSYCPLRSEILPSHHPYCLISYSPLFPQGSQATSFATVPWAWQAESSRWLGSCSASRHLDTGPSSASASPLLNHHPLQRGHPWPAKKSNFSSLPSFHQLDFSPEDFSVFEVILYNYFFDKLGLCLRAGCLSKTVYMVPAKPSSTKTGSGTQQNMHAPLPPHKSTEHTEWVSRSVYIRVCVCTYTFIYIHTALCFFPFFFYFSDALISGPFRTLEGLPRIVG